MKDREEEQPLKVVDRRRFTLNNDGTVAENPDAEKEMPPKTKGDTEDPQPAPAAAAPEQQSAGTDRPAEPQAETAKSSEENVPPQHTEGVPLMNFLQQQAYLAMIYLGQQPHPATGLVQAQPEGAREVIDVLLMLRSRTQNNLTREEEFALGDLIHQLQLAYLKATDPMATAAAANPKGEQK